MRRLALTLLLLVATAGAISGCASSASTGATGSSGPVPGVLTLGTDEPLVSFDPYNGIDQQYIIDHTLYSYLITYDLKRQARPDLATSWHFASDHRSITVHLRKAEFSDGTPVTSQDIVAGIKRAENPETGLTEAGVTAFIKRVVPAGPRVFTIDFKQPTARDTVLDFMFFFPVVEAAHDNPVALQSHAYGSGPFVVQSYTPDNTLVLKRNPHYYDPSQPKVNTVRIKFFDDQASMVAALQFGQLDSAEFVDYNDLDELKHTFRIIHGSPAAETAMFYLNPETPPFNVKGCRQAVVRAIDRRRIMEVAQGGEGYPVPGPFTPGTVGYDRKLLSTNGYDLAAARAGIAKYCRTKTATAVVQPTPPYTEQAMEIMSYDLARAGFTLKLEKQDAATFVTDLHLGTTQAALYPTVNPFLSPPSLLTNRSFSPLTDNYWWGKQGAPAEYKRATAKIESAVTPAQTRRAVTGFNRALADQSWVTGLFTQLNLFVVNKHVTGFTHNPADMIVLNNVVVH